MTLFGKILTLAILIMSLVFMTFAVLVYATHKNWRDAILNTDTAGGKPLGLKPQLEQAYDVNKQLKDKIREIENDAAMEKAARREAIGALITKLAQARDALDAKEAELAGLVSAQGETAQALKTAEETLASLTTEVNGLRDEIRTAQDDRDKQFDEVLALTDKVNQLDAVQRQLEARRKQLLTQNTAYKKVMDRHGLTEFTPVVDIEPEVRGVVTAVGEKDFVEITIGGDDGLRPGHKLEVYRGAEYVGRVIVHRTEPDKAVALIDRKYLKTPIKKGDRVTTKLG